MVTESDADILRRGAAIWGLSLDDTALARFEKLAELLIEANTRVNLTRVAPKDIVSLHFLDSLSIAAAVPLQVGMGLIDVGTGGGFPGLPLAIAYPEMHVTMVDGTRKKLDFIDAVIADLGITNAVTVHARAEDLAKRNEYRVGFDIAAARAVARLPQLARWLLPLVKPTGAAVAYKGRDVSTELNELRESMGRLEDPIYKVTEVTIPFTEIVRTLVVMKSPAHAVAGRSHVRGISK